MCCWKDLVEFKVAFPFYFRPSPDEDSVIYIKCKLRANYTIWVYKISLPNLHNSQPVSIPAPTTSRTQQGGEPEVAWTVSLVAKRKGLLISNSLYVSIVAAFPLGAGRILVHLCSSVFISILTLIHYVWNSSNTMPEVQAWLFTSVSSKSFKYLIYIFSLHFLKFSQLNSCRDEPLLTIMSNCNLLSCSYMVRCYRWWERLNNIWGARCCLYQI